MSEDNYEAPLPRTANGRTIVLPANRGGKTLHLIQQVLQAAADSPNGRIDVMRLDRETDEWTTDVITADMPADEIIV